MTGMVHGGIARDTSPVSIHVQSGERRMVTVTWGNVLAIVLPGGLMIFGLRFLHHSIQDLLSKPNELTVAGATCLLLAATLVGGVIDGVRRVAFEDRFKRLRLLLRRACASRPASEPRSPGLYEFVTPQNLSLFETLVENSFRYYAFYGNLFCALVIMLPVRFLFAQASGLDLGFLAVTPMVGYAAYVQHDMFSAAMNGFVAVEKQRRAGADSHAD